MKVKSGVLQRPHMMSASRGSSGSSLVYARIGTMANTARFNFSFCGLGGIDEALCGVC